MRAKSQTVVALFSVLCCALSLFGQPAPGAIDFESGKWVIDDPDARVMTYMNRQSLFLYSGVAYLREVEFENGVIEIDIAPHGNRGFAGVVFRFQSNEDHELFYLRPHKSGSPDALQYTPVFNGLAGWQLYSNDGFTAAADIPANTWVHLKLVILGTRAEVYLNNAPQPSLVISELKRGLGTGSIGLWGRAGAANFASFRFSTETPTLPSANDRPVEILPEYIRRWSLSQAFDAKQTRGDQLPAAAELKAMQWLDVESEATGLVNLARFRRKVNPIERSILTTQKDVVFAKTTIRSDRNQVKKLSFGYSDEISIFLNGQILFTGNSTFLARDPGFLGIVGVDNDAVYLNLKKGENELVLAVTETFGGWGFICKFDNLTGIALR